MKALASLTFAALLVAGPALAGTPVTLKADVTDADGLVTLGDLFDGAGAAAGVPLAARTGQTMMLNAATVQAAARRAGLDWANAQGIRQIVVRGGAPAVAQRGNVEVLTWSRNIMAGETIQATDLIWGKAAMAPTDAPSDPDMVVGLAARRPLRMGAAVAGRDIAAVEVVKAGEIVTLTYEADGVSLALQAKAVTGGGVGETINVQNVSSKKVVQAVVTGPGQAAVGPAADQLKLLNRSTRVALR
ncbi:flagellar basal body P-ring formation chaperone FlgA [Phenylobacterium sp. J426]|uniref:flagellar basal body P-ring formation chaperone FlgA n=1 Tax=Phenylobacterium sp. J426 TaxID=2898439 RepID=UPI002151905A|nr:flagellar basal body P-ring formation chaperone FlgA [Phenylobacterium sp. J426]MCR5874904.1 flagellar basal body P-ring formation chaperone FlgA [Phenylobacterium sp. J426]